MKALSVKLGVILIGLIIFSYMEVSRGECAWVLWKQEGSRVEGKWYPPQWEIDSAFPTYDLCIQYRIKELNRRKERYIYNKTPISTYDDGSGFIILNRENNITEFSYQSKCLPDTIDPRK